MTADADPEPDDAVELPPLDPPVEPGRPSLENALFVTLGILLALGVVFRLYQLFG